MTVSLYTGHVGSGKSYEVVKSVILPALMAGRSVVSNVEGLDVEAIEEWCEKAGCQEVGKLVVVDKLDVRDAKFFPERQKDGSYVPSAFVPLGALVVIDEAPFYWGTDKTILPQHLAFFREHRHITAEDGTACDLVVCAQAVGDIHRSLKSLVEFSIECRRLAALGLNRKYTAITYEGAKRAQKYIMGRATRTYDRAIFPLYRSFSRGSGKIVQTDQRFTIWSAKWFWMLFLASPVGFGAALWMLYRAFFGAHHVAVVAAAGAAAIPGFHAPLPTVAGASVLSGMHGAPLLPPLPPPPRKPLPGDATDGSASLWKVAGSVKFDGQPWAVMRRPGYPLRYMPLSACLLSFGFPVSCRAGDQVFEPDTGSSRAAAAPAGVWAPDALAAKAAKK